MSREGLLGLLFGVLALGSFAMVPAQNLLLNPGFESWIEGKPDHWYGTTACTTYKTIDTLHSGYCGCKLEFTSSTETQWLEQYVDVSPSLNYTCSLWVYDNYPHSKARVYLRWYDASNSYISYNSSSYSSDSSSWQVLTWSGLSPSDADSLHFEIRAYDEAWGDTIDTAYFYVDDAAIMLLPMSPVISNVTRTPDAPDAADTVIISARITDEGSVTADSMFYKINSGSFTPTHHDSVSTSTYYYHINPQSNNDTVCFYIWAKDNDDSVSVSDTSSYVVNPQATVSLPLAYGSPGDTVAVPISVSDLTGMEVLSFQFVVVYDTTILTAVGIDTSSTLLNGAGWLTEWNTDTDSVSVASSGAYPLSNSGDLIKLLFKVSSGASTGDSSGLIFTSFTFNEGTPEVVTEDNAFIVIGSYGDVSGNGEVMAYDASLVLQYLLDLVPLTLSQQIVADVSGADGITALDASLILQYVVETITGFPVETGGKEFPTSAVLTLEDVSGAPGGIVNVPVLIENPEGLFSSEFTLTFDPNLLSLEDVSTTLSGYQCLYKEEEGEVKVVLAGTESPEEANTVNFTFRVKEDAELGCKISLKDVRLNEKDVISNGSSCFFVANPALLTFHLYSVRPNPGRQFTIRYCLPVDGYTILKLYDITGRTIRTLVDGPTDAGEHTAKWDGKDDAGKPVSSGIYFYQLKSSENNEIKKLTILR